jgi:hypothetical protein
MSNIIYLLTNPSMPEIVKIGFTSNLKTRMKSLYSSSVPVPFECYFACTVKDMNFIEQQIHDGFDDFRVNPKREFFRIDPERIVSILKMVMIEDVTPKENQFEDKEDEIAFQKETTIAQRFNFEMVGIPIGSTLTFLRDENFLCTVVSHNRVEFEGENCSLSGAALKLTHRMGFNWKRINGPKNWKFEGEVLTDRRARLELSE